MTLMRGQLVQEGDFTLELGGRGPRRLRFASWRLASGEDHGDLPSASTPCALANDGESNSEFYSSVALPSTGDVDVTVAMTSAWNFKRRCPKTLLFAIALKASVLH